MDFMSSDAVVKPHIFLFLSASATTIMSTRGDHGGSPSPRELMEQLDLCDLTNSCTTTPSISPSPSLLSALFPYSHRPYFVGSSSTLAATDAGATPERQRRHLAEVNKVKHKE